MISEITAQIIVKIRLNNIPLFPLLCYNVQKRTGNFVKNGNQFIESTTEIEGKLWGTHVWRYVMNSAPHICNGSDTYTNL